jgi:CheY-like chemotaxis protein
MLREMLQQIGHQVETVSNGFEAIEALIKQRFDLVLMDITMPGLDGLGATEQIRTSEGAMRAVPIIACSAHVGPEVQDRYRRVGIDAFLPKPVDPAALDSVIRQVARRR